MKSEFYTIGNDQLNGWTEKKLQSTSQCQTVTKKGHGHCSVVCCLSDSLQFFESWQNHYIWQVCSANWWDALKLQCLKPALVNRKGPILIYKRTRSLVAQPALPKLNELGYDVLPYSPCSPDVSPTDYYFFKHPDNFLQGKPFHNERDAENAFQEFTDSWSIDFFLFWSIAFYATGINKLISHWQKCVFCNGSYFD